LAALPPPSGSDADPHARGATGGGDGLGEEEGRKRGTHGNSWELRQLKRELRELIEKANLVLSESRL
jgi:hypothetical protein